MKLDMLVFGAHPDDAELGAGGTIAMEIAQGKKIGIVDLTQGELGTRGSAEIRSEEAAASAKILGVSIRENLGFSDGFFVNDSEHQVEVIKMIRKYRPEIVLCNAVEDRHIDHGRGSKLVSDACFLSGLVKIETVLDDEEIQPVWRPKNVYHYIQWKNLKPDFVVDISGFLHKKKEAILAYSSQFHDPKSSEPETPISSVNFLDSVEYRARDLGRLVGVDHAEGFTTEKHIAIKSLNAIF